MLKKINIKLKLVAIALMVLSISSCSKEQVHLSDLNETIYVRHANADMPAHIHGNGSEKVFLIILHGGPGGNGLSFRVNTIRTEIEKNNAVVYFDQRGSGNAQGNYAQEDVSIDLMAEDVLALAEVIKAKYGEDSKLFLFGTSWGGTLGTATLLKNQEDFLGWIDVAGAHNHKGFFDEYKIDLTETANEQIALGNSVDYWQDVIESVQDVGPNYSPENQIALNIIANTVDPILTEDNIINDAVADLGDDAPIRNQLTTNWNSNLIGQILDYQEDLGSVSYADRLSEITIPSLILWGAHDHVVPVKFAHEAYDNLGSSDKELFFFERSGHTTMFTEPNLFSDKIIDFINEHK